MVHHNLFVVGARPNFPKVSPVLTALDRHPKERASLVHTGQHYDVDMSEAFFEDLELPKPDRLLGIGSGSHAEQTARVMIAFEEVCRDMTPDRIVVVGDVNSTLACALVASKLGIPTAHIEAGLRSWDRIMPEEINRVLTDHLAQRLYTHCREANDNLQREGIDNEHVRFVGNTMIDTLLRCRQRAKPSTTWAELGVERRRYGLVTLHRPTLVDNPKKMSAMLAALIELSKDIPLVYPVHPRTIGRLRNIGVIDHDTDLRTPLAIEGSMLKLIAPLRYLAFIHAMDNARFVLTDSGGVQEETTCLGIPCMTVRDNTERAVTIREGTNRLVGTRPEDVLREARRELGAPFEHPSRVPELWDGRTGERIAADLASWEV